MVKHWLTLVKNWLIFCESNQFCVAWFDNNCYILCTAVAYLDIILINVLQNLLEGGKC